MSEDFLHRIRIQPPPQFLARLKAKLDRLPPGLDLRARLVRSLAAGVLVGASALALASLALHGGFAGLHWSGWGTAQVDSTPEQLARRPAATPEAPGQQQGQPTDGWVHNPWAVASDPMPGKSRKRQTSGGAAIVPIPQSSSATPDATVARYSGGNAVVVPAGTERLRIAVALHAESFAQKVAASFVRAGFNEPQLLILPVDTLFASLCADNSIDLATVPRRMTAAEGSRCAHSGVGPMVEVKHGYHAVALVRSKVYGPLPLTVRDVFLALSRTVPDPANPAAEVPNHSMTWNEVDPALPPDRIQVLGPELSSEVAQTFVTLVMEAGCNTFPSLAALQGAAHDESCRRLREDGVYSVMPEVPPGIVDRLQMQPTMLGIVPYSSLQYSGDALVASPLNGIQPTLQSIEENRYPGSRTLYLYVNSRQAHRMSSARAFVLTFINTIPRYTPGSFIPLNDGERAQILTNALSALGPQQ
jgi:phosphate transport system substrate-binding protein